MRVRLVVLVAALLASSRARLHGADAGARRRAAQLPRHAAVHCRRGRLRRAGQRRAR